MPRAFTALERRVTHKYVGTYSHLDDWETFGRVYVVAIGEPEYPEGENLEDSYSRKVFVRVAVDENMQDGVDERSIRQALHDSYTSVGCSHDYDCCGCRSFWADAEHIKDDLWLIDIQSSRNF